MVELLSGMDFNHFSPRIYVIAETDETSSQRVRQLETIRKTDTREVRAKLLNFLPKPFTNSP